MANRIGLARHQHLAGLRIDDNGRIRLGLCGFRDFSMFARFSRRIIEIRESDQESRKDQAYENEEMVYPHIFVHVRFYHVF
jgi:hypothetical protein